MLPCTGISGNGGADNQVWGLNKNCGRCTGSPVEGPAGIHLWHRIPKPTLFREAIFMDDCTGDFFKRSHSHSNETSPQNKAGFCLLRDKVGYGLIRHHPHTRRMRQASMHAKASG